MGPGTIDTHHPPATITPLRRQATIDYFVAFDCLGQPQPILAGFVRQQGNKNSSFAALAERWRWRLNDLCLSHDPNRPAPPDVCEMLDDAGFDGAALSLFYRSVNAEERMALELLGAKEGRVLKCLVPDSEGQWRAVWQTGQSIPGTPIRLPDTLARASLGSFAPKLVSAKRSRHTGVTLAEAIARFPSAQGDVVRERLVDVAGLDPISLARSAASDAGSALIRSAGLDDWKFTVRPQDWTASHDNGARRVVVRAQALRLLVELQLVGSDQVHEVGSFLLPASPDDQVPMLLRLLDGLRNVASATTKLSSTRAHGGERAA